LCDSKKEEEDTDSPHCLWQKITIQDQIYTILIFHINIQMGKSADYGASF
jgi:hypothetical protein